MVPEGVFVDLRELLPGDGLDGPLLVVHFGGGQAHRGEGALAQDVAHLVPAHMENAKSGGEANAGTGNKTGEEEKPQRRWERGTKDAPGGEGHG